MVISIKPELKTLHVEKWCLLPPAQHRPATRAHSNSNSQFRQNCKRSPLPELLPLQTMQTTTRHSHLPCTGRTSSRVRCLSQPLTMTRDPPVTST